jgi:ubiquinone/menaquinone biosynthesis C-methylase UbiE
MDKQTRILGQSVEIEYSSTHAFFEQRANKVQQVGILGVTMYQDRSPGLAETRDGYEEQIATPLLNLTDQTRVLDIGCGTGRWGFHLVGKVQSYLDIDYSEKIIAIANQDLEKSTLDPHGCVDSA